MWIIISRFYKNKKILWQKKIIFFSTPFDVESVFFLKSIGVKLFKVASFDISNYELLRAISKTKLPTIISTGMANRSEIEKFKKKNFSFTGIKLSKQRRNLLFVMYKFSKR